MADVNGAFVGGIVEGFSDSESLHSADGALITLTAGGSPAVFIYYEMRGLDSGAGAVTWVVTGSPDPNGALATPANTTPTLIGTVVAGSGKVLSVW